MSFRFVRAGLSGFAIALLPLSQGAAHVIVGNRFFPATLTVDDPGVNDELEFPTVDGFNTGDIPPVRQLELDVVRRFSTLGIISVLALILTGIINAVILVGSFRGLVLTDYGRVLIVKLAAFAIMVTFASVNRLLVTPRLARAGENKARADLVKTLARNTRIELGLALAIFAIVGVLGTLHPAMHHLMK